MQLLPFIGTVLLCMSAVSTSQVDIVINDITELDKDVQSLTAKVRAYNGGLIAQTPQLFGLTQVHLATRKGYYDSKLLPNPLSESDAARIIDHVGETLSIDNPIAVEVLKSKKDLFDAAGTSPAIALGLKVLLDDHLAFSDEVEKRVSKAQAETASEVVDVITRALQDGITTFS